MPQILTDLVEFLLLFEVFTLNFKIECAIGKSVLNLVAEIARIYMAVVRTFMKQKILFLFKSSYALAA